MNKINYEEIGRAELKVDCYAGKTCDQHKPEWHGHFDGDMDGGKIGKRITLDVSQFRPGTRVLIQEPVCPRCDATREMCELDKGCDFNWRAWDEEQYA
jgi:hypothetical protein